MSISSTSFQKAPSLFSESIVGVQSRSGFQKDELIRMLCYFHMENQSLT